MTMHWKGILAAARLLVLGLAAGVFITPATAAAQAPNPGAPTFNKDVAPILQRSCQNCHRPGSIGPMPLLTYEEARPWARAIKSRVMSRSMPPWHIDKTVGIQKFKDDISLTDQEIATIVGWADAGAPRGEAADMPQPKKFDDLNAWQIKPDLIVEIPRDYVVPAQGPDAWREFLAPTGLTETRYYRAVQTMPGAHRAVHHMSSVVIQTMAPEEVLPGMEDNLEGGSTVEDLKSGNPVETFLSSYEVGKNADVMPDGTGRMLKAGSIVKFEVHYSSVGEELRDRSRVGLSLYPRGYVPKYFQVTKGIGQPRTSLDIPAGAVDVRVDGYQRLTRPARISAVQAHMHQRGKRMCMEALLPTGTIEQLNCMNFDFKWQKLYVYADDVAPLLPAGTIVHVIGWFDNSSANRENPDPRNWVGSGSRSNDEMFFARTTWTYLEEEDYKRMVAERQAAAKARTQN